MKIAILGGGITGLTAGYYVTKKGHEATLFEKEANLGGLASGFRSEGWEWPLERAYHHIFASDTDIRNFAEEIGYRDIFFTEPITSSLYSTKKMGPVTPSSQKEVLGEAASFFATPSGRATPFFQVYPLDTPIDLLQFPLLSFSEKMRAGITLGFLKLSPFLNVYEREYAEGFLKKTMGNGAWNVLWEELFRKKFGKYAGNIVASFIWARVKKRTKQLGYMKGGFQTFIDYMEETNNKVGVDIKKGEGVGDIVKKGDKFILNNQEFDVVISTLPTTLMTKITAQIFPKNYISKFDKLHYLHAVNLIIESTMPLFEKEYWVSICSKNLPFMVAVQHTNMIDKLHYGGNHILYVGNYIDRDDKLLKMENEEILNYFLPYLKQINPKYLPAGRQGNIQDTKYHVFKAPWAQPIFDKDFITNKPDFETPVKNFFIANLDMTYPYDRGTNYAVKLGKEVSAFV